MISLLLSEIANECGGTLYGEDIAIGSLSTDSRSIQAGDVFLAIVGDKFDGHSHAESATEKGASALVVSRKQNLTIPQVVVQDTKQALGKIGSLVHRRCDIPTVAITGSCGKTTVKEMLASILSLRGNVLFTNGNFNNDIGVPLTLLRAEPEHDYAVIELGANHIGEIAYTTQLVNPDIAMVNNVAAAHLEGFGSIDGVKQAKGEIYQGLSAEQPAIVNLDSHGEGYWNEVLADKRVVTISLDKSDADFFATDIVVNDNGGVSFTLNTPNGSQAVSLGLVGKHNVANAIAAAALATQLNLDNATIAQGLAKLNKVKSRVDVVELNDNLRLIDDAYNASVPAMFAAIDLLGNYQGSKWLILGSMAELGEQSLELHSQVGQHAAPFEFEQVLTYGDDAKVISDICNNGVCHGQHFESHQTMIDYITVLLENNKHAQTTLLVKGALSSGMGQIVSALKEKYQ